MGRLIVMEMAGATVWAHAPMERALHVRKGRMIVMEMARVTVLAYVTRESAIHKTIVQKLVLLAIPPETIAATADANINPLGLTGVLANVGLIMAIAIQMMFVVQAVAITVIVCHHIIVNSGGGRLKSMRRRPKKLIKSCPKVLFGQSVKNFTAVSSPVAGVPPG